MHSDLGQVHLPLSYRARTRSDQFPTGILRSFTVVKDIVVNLAAKPSDLQVRIAIVSSLSMLVGEPCKFAPDVLDYFSNLGLPEPWTACGS